MSKPQIVMDTNVLVAGLRSRRGNSFRLLTLIDSDKFQINLSVPLAVEYEDVTKRLISDLPYTEGDIDVLLNYLCQIANRWKIYYLWRPFLRDSKDEMVLELAVTASCDFIVTHNKRDFAEVHRFGIQVVTPQEFLREIGALP